MDQGDRLALEQQLQYIERPPVSLERLEYREDGNILYRGNYNPSLGRDYQLCSPLEFLAMLIPHVTLRFECRIHSYGAISTTIRRQLGWIEKKEKPEAPEGVVVVEEEESEFVKLRLRNWARLIAKVYLENPALCGSCGKEMKIISALTSPHQDDVIERILRARDEWDPPWRRERRARGPPKQREIFTAEDYEFSQVAPESEEEFSPPESEEEFSQLPPDGSEDT